MARGSGTRDQSGPRRRRAPRDGRGPPMAGALTDTLGVRLHWDRREIALQGERRSPAPWPAPVHTCACGRNEVDGAALGWTALAVQLVAA